MLTQGTAPDCRHTRVFISPNNVNVFVSGLFAVIETGKNSKFHYTDVGYLFFACRLIVLGYLYDVKSFISDCITMFVLD